MVTKDIVDELERKVVSLKTSYEQYFLRIEKREPLRLREEVDKMIISLSTQPVFNTALKFRLNSIVAKYNTYKNYWIRVLRAIEEGRYERDLFRANAAAGASAKGGTPASRSFGEDDRLKALYGSYLEKRKECNESVDGITYDKLKNAVSRQVDKIREKYKCKDVDLKVYVKNGRAKIAITPKIDKPAR